MDWPRPRRVASKMVLGGGARVWTSWILDVENVFNYIILDETSLDSISCI